MQLVLSGLLLGGLPMRWRKLNYLSILIFIVVLCAGCQARAMPSAEMALADADTSSSKQMEVGAADESAGSLTDTRKIIANANVSLVVSDTEEAVEGIETIASDMGGYLADVELFKDSYGEAEVLRGSLTLRVPAASLNDALTRLQALATDVRHLNVSRQDVTDQYSDLNAQLRNLRATETELLALLTEVRQKPNAKVEDILTVHRNLMQIREEIERLQGRKNLLDNQIGFSTIWIEVIPDSVNRPIVEEAWSASGPARNALRALVQTLQGLMTALIWAVLYLAPLLLVLLIPLAVLIWLARYLMKRRRKVDE